MSPTAQAKSGSEVASPMSAQPVQSQSADFSPAVCAMSASLVGATQDVYDKVSFVLIRKFMSSWRQ
jgi:hypothetical protein